MARRMIGTAQSVGQSLTTTVPKRTAENPCCSHSLTAVCAACSVKNVICMIAPGRKPNRLENIPTTRGFMEPEEAKMSAVDPVPKVGAIQCRGSVRLDGDLRVLICLLSW